MQHDKYDFSYTASSLRLNEMVLVAGHIINETEIDFVNELGAGKSATGKRIYREINKRLSLLTLTQLELLVRANLEIKKQIAFYATCKTYLFIRDFTLEVIREKYLVFDYEISEGDYISFLRRKQELHPEIENLSDSSMKKIKQVTFKILEQAGIINSSKEKLIQPQLVQQDIVEAISQDNPEWLKIFLMSDLDIKNSSI
jgi:hypothetical protein